MSRRIVVGVFAEEEGLLCVTRAARAIGRAWSWNGSARFLNTRRTSPAWACSTAWRVASARAQKGHW